MPKRSESDAVDIPSSVSAKGGCTGPGATSNRGTGIREHNTQGVE